MPRFHEAFIFLADGSDPVQRGAQEDALVRREFVPVPDAATAAAVAAELQAGGLDNIELYGGLGPIAATRVLEATGGGQVPVGLVGLEEARPVRNRAIIFEAPGADPATGRYVLDHAGGRMTIVAVPDPSAAPAAARELVDAGAERIEMCGGMGTVPTAAVIEAVGDRATVAAVLFGFESMPAVAAYRTRFEQALGG